MAWGTPQLGRAQGKAPAVPRFLNKASGRMETAKQIHQYRVPAAAQALGAPKAKPQQQRQPQRHQASAVSQPKSWLEMNPAQLQQFASTQVKAQTQAELSPFKQKGVELSNAERNASQRYGGLTEGTDKLLAGIQSGAESSAKTAQNEAADAALKAAKSVETSGQAMAQQNAGYTDPQLQNQLAAEKANLQGIGTAREGAAATLGQNEANFMTNLRAVAAARATEGQRGIASTYAQKQGENQSQQNQILGRQAGNISKLQTELLQKQFTNRATEQGLGIKVGQLGVQKQNAATKAFSVQNTAQTRAVQNRQRQEKLGLENRKQSFGEWATREKVAISQLSAADQARYHEAEVRYKNETANGKAPSPEAGRKYEAKLSTAVQIARSILGDTNQGRGTRVSQTEARKTLAEKGATSDEIAAALNLAVYGRLSTADQAAAISYGLTPNLRPEWFRPAPKRK